MKKADPVVALLTAGGKTLWLPAPILGMLETMAKHPRKLFGHTRPEVIRSALCAYETLIERFEKEKEKEEQRKHEARVLEIRNRSGFLPPRDTGAVAAEMEPATLAVLDDCMSHVLAIVEPEKLSGHGVLSLVMDRLGEAGDRRKAARTAGKEAA